MAAKKKTAADYSFAPCDPGPAGGRAWAVTGGGRPYTVRDRGGGWTCGCDGFRWKNRCRHIRLVKGEPMDEDETKVEAKPKARPKAESREVVPAQAPAALPEAVERLVILGDLSKLSPEDRVRYYGEVCKSLGLNPLTRPFDYITLSGRLTLYARKDAADQLRRLHEISVEVVSRDTTDGVLIVHARATMPGGRSDEDFGAVPVAGLKGEAAANAVMKAVTKAKRRVTLSVCGLGMLDETEVESVQQQEREAVTRAAPAAQGRTLQEAMAADAPPARPAPAPAKPAPAHANGSAPPGGPRSIHDRLKAQDANFCGRGLIEGGELLAAAVADLGHVFGDDVAAWGADAEGAVKAWLTKYAASIKSAAGSVSV